MFFILLGICLVLLGLLSDDDLILILSCYPTKFGGNRTCRYKVFNLSRDLVVDVSCDFVAEVLSS